MTLLLESSTHVYDTIDHATTKIRLFTLLPSVENDAPLCGRLHTVDLEPNPPAYEALSYVWDDQYYANSSSSTPPASFALRLDNRETTISQNLASALVRIRHSREPRVLWIDAICIDQQNALEKNHQVQQMYNIYSSAYRVLIWLGNDNLDDSEHSSGFLLTSNRRYIKVAGVLSRSWWGRIW